MKDSVISFPMFSIHYGMQIPGGDMADRFGINSAAGGSVMFKTAKNLLIGLHGSFLFGNDLKEESILDNLRNHEGNIIGIDGKIADVRLYERGMLFGLTAGKIFPVFKKPNRNSGIFVSAGTSFLQHKIRIEPIGNTVPHLDKEYRKGYDRLTNGMGLHESIGYVFFRSKGLVNFYGCLDFVQVFTKNRRDYNFDTMMKDDKSRTDMLMGLRVGWIVPIYKKSTGKFYLY